jgi:hypothetical protein
MLLFGARDFGLRQAKRSDYDGVLSKTMGELRPDDRRDQADRKRGGDAKSAPEADDDESEEGDQARAAATAAAARRRRLRTDSPGPFVRLVEPVATEAAPSHLR